MLNSILESGTMTLFNLFLCTGASLVLGVLTASLYMIKNTYSKGFVIILALLPAMVQMVIMLVNGNLGTGVAVMGAFSLVRFRSLPGSAKDIGSLFLAMALGLATGMGYLAIAFIMLLVLGSVQLVLTFTSFGNQKSMEKELKIAIPEDLDDSEIFYDIFAEYTKSAELIQVKTTNMGSLFELKYYICLKKKNTEKELIDSLRCRNGNLSISLGRISTAKEEL